jgi:hypothetical protein
VIGDSRNKIGYKNHGGKKNKNELFKNINSLNINYWKKRKIKINISKKGKI